MTPQVLPTTWMRVGLLRWRAGRRQQLPLQPLFHARKREGNFGLQGKVDAPLEQALAEVLAASRNGNLTSFDAGVERCVAT